MTTEQKIIAVLALIGVLAFIITYGTPYFEATGWTMTAIVVFAYYMTRKYLR